MQLRKILVCNNIDLNLLTEKSGKKVFQFFEQFCPRLKLAKRPIWCYLASCSYLPCYWLLPPNTLPTVHCGDTASELNWLGDHVTHSIWSFQVGFLESKPNESRHSDAVKHPGGKTEVVYECLETTWIRQQHDPGNNTLSEKTKQNKKLLVSGYKNTR